MDDSEILKKAKQIRATKEKTHRAEIKSRILCSAAPALGTRRYPVILADPPWSLKGSTHSLSRNPCNHYPVMKLEEIINLPVNSISTDDAVLFIWAVNNILDDCLKVIKAWGFTYITNAVWVKDKIGLGFYVRYQHELLLIAKKGKMIIPEPENRPSSVIFAPRTKHSAKPDEVYTFIEQMFPDFPKIELFARNHQPGWHAWGNQVKQTSPILLSAMT